MRNNRPTRGRLLGALLAIALIALTACSAGTDTPSVTEQAASTAEAGAFPVTIEHKFGATTIEAQPQRIVTLGLKEQDDLLALGIVPVGATKWLELGEGGVIGEWAQDALGDAPAPEVLSIDNGADVEAIAALQPDLIIALYSGTTAEEYQKLSALAPVVAQPEGYVDYGVPWDVQAQTVGAAVGHPGRMGEIIDAAKSALVEAAAANPQFQGQIGAVATPYEGVYVYGPQDPRSRLLTELGFTLPEGMDAMIGTDEFGGNLSEENIAFLDTDLLLWFAPEEARTEISDRELYRTLRVHTEGRDIFIGTDDTIDAPFSFITALSLPYLLDALVPRLQAAVDGDPATSTDEQH
jgi:iron complex transport system substrate-binding protein